MASGNGSGNGAKFWADPVKMTDLAMAIINRVGLPLVILGLVAYYLMPAHLAFMHTATEAQQQQTAIIQELKDTATRALSSQSSANERIESLTRAIATGDREKLNGLETIENKVDRAGQTLTTIDAKVDAVKAALEKKP